MDWLGQSPPELYVANTYYPVSGPNTATIDANFVNGVPLVQVVNRQDRKLRVTRLVVDLGCNVSATIHKVWVEHNIHQDDQKGMLIHVDFSVANQRGFSSAATAFFSYQSGENILDGRGKRVYAQTTFKPTYDNSRYRDLKIFIPNSQLPRGKLRFRIQLWDSSSRAYFVYSEYILFNVS